MSSILSFRGKPISTNSHGHADPARISNYDTKSLDGKNFARRYDCEDYLDCLFRASVANASRLPCKGCNKYSPKYAEEERKYNTELWL
jgi:hypothetical protein